MDHPSGTTVLVLGILGFVACQLLAPVAWYLGNKALREIDAAPGRYSNRGSVQAGRILGIIGTVIIILYLVMGLVFLVGIVSLGTTSSSSSGSSGYRYLNSSTTLEQCKTDTKVLKTALVAWNTEYLSGDNSNYRTPWPEYEAQLTESGTQLLEEESRLHNLVGGGTTAPRIVKAPGMCLDEEIVQLN